MLRKTVIFHCPKCNSPQVIKNGKNSAGSQQFLCKVCHKSAVMHPQNQRSQAEKEQILSAYHERPRLRGIARTNNVSRNTLKKLLKKSERPTHGQRESITRTSRRYTGLNEVWSFVFIKTAKYWLWTAICRRTRQIVAFVIGDQSAQPANNYGTRSQKNTVIVTRSVIFGMRIKRFFQKKPIAVWVRTAEQPITWNVGIAPFAKS